MKLSRALIISLFVTLVLTLLLQFFFGALAYGLFLFLPLGLWFGRKRPVSSKLPSDRPLEPK